MATITVNGYGEVSVPPDEAAVYPVARQASFAAIADAAPPIEAGELTVACTVSVTFQVEPA